jgi:F-type H+-transporting ATPase subunit gamma
MATLREIKSRIGSIRNIEKITRAMKMVASVKFRKAQMNVVAARPYARKIDEILRNLIPTVEDFDNPLLKEREVKKLCLIVVTGDRGLCGSFNTNLIKHVENSIKTTYADFYNAKELTLVTIGKKGYDHFNKRHYDFFAKYTNIFDKLQFIHAQNIITELISGYCDKKFDKVVAIYNEFKSVAQSKIVEEQILPIPPFPKAEGAKNILSNYIYEPSSKEIVEHLLPRSLKTQIWRILLESYASEQAAQMTAMDSATTNANDLMKTLQLSYNRARQASITKEILEIVGGAEALRESN